MSAGAWMMALAIAIALGALGFIIWTLVRSIQTQRSGRRSVWREFGLGLALTALFFASWGAQAITQWQTFTDEQRTFGQDPAIGDFLAEFGQSTMENWQSEFLQLFAFVVLASLYIHRGSAESKDGEERIAASLRRIEEQLGTLPHPEEPNDEPWQLPDTPQHHADEEERRASPVGARPGGDRDDRHRSVRQMWDEELRSVDLRDQR